MIIGDFTADTSDFDKMCSELAAVCSAPPDNVIREEVGKVLSKALDNTRVADASKIRQHSTNAKFTLLPATIYAPSARQGKRKVHPKGRMILYNLNRRYPARLWQAIQKARAIDLKRRLAARGLARQSWYKLGLLLGVNVEAPAYVKKAVATTGKTYKDEAISTQKGAASIAITISTSQPTLNAISGDMALQRAINGRIQYFAVNVVKGVFDIMATAAKKYPGVVINP